jgi:hypothetical protein
MPKFFSAASSMLNRTAAHLLKYQFAADKLDLQSGIDACSGICPIYIRNE